MFHKKNDLGKFTDKKLPVSMLGAIYVPWKQK